MLIKSHITKEESTCNSSSDLQGSKRPLLHSAEGKRSKKESKDEELKVISEKLEIINQQLYQRQELKRRKKLNVFIKY